MKKRGRDREDEGVERNNLFPSLLIRSGPTTVEKNKRKMFSEFKVSEWVFLVPSTEHSGYYKHLCSILYSGPEISFPPFLLRIFLPKQKGSHFKETFKRWLPHAKALFWILKPNTSYPVLERGSFQVAERTSTVALGNKTLNLEGVDECFTLNCYCLSKQSRIKNPLSTPTIILFYNSTWAPPPTPPPNLFQKQFKIL